MVMNARILAGVAAGAAMGLTLGACGSSPASGSGTVTGQLPLCYGPGPNLNLTPTTAIEVRQSGHLVETKTFPSDAHHQRYSLTLPAGTYEFRANLTSISVTINADSSAQADFPQPGCL